MRIYPSKGLNLHQTSRGCLTRSPVCISFSKRFLALTNFHATQTHSSPAQDQVPRACIQPVRPHGIAARVTRGALRERDPAHIAREGGLTEEMYMIMAATLSVSLKAGDKFGWWDL